MGCNGVWRDDGGRVMTSWQAEITPEQREELQDFARKAFSGGKCGLI